MKLIKTILDEMLNVSKSQKKILIKLVEAIISMHVKINYRSLERYTGLCAKTFSRWFERCFDFARFNEIAISKTISKGDEFIVAFDQSFIEKAGDKTRGTDKFWDGCNSKASDGLEISLVSLINTSTGTAFSLEARQTPSTAEIKLTNKDDTRMDFYIKFISEFYQAIKKYTRYFVADGFFTKKKFVDFIVGAGLYFIGKLRKDANLMILYNGERQKKAGRPRLYAGKCDLDILDNFNFEADFDEKTKLYSNIFFSKSMGRKIKVVVVIKKLKKRIGKAFIFSTDLDLSALKILLYYRSRYQIEFIFREAKQHTGLCDCQARNEKALNFHFNVSLLALNLVKVQHHFNLQKLDEKLPFSMLSYKASYNNENLISRFYSKLGLDQTEIKLSPAYQEMLNYGTIYPLGI